ncbi:MAG: autotransporter-associated beta strand repeat-containing protein [Kiritimatiellae bacterium]|nr:autotransporter-associated beta strand repeat-containing protein [Kiritimatiellia bacterium]
MTIWCYVAVAAFSFTALADDPVYPAVPTTRGYGLVDAFVSGENASIGYGIFRSDSAWQTSRSGLSHRSNTILKPQGFEYDFVPDGVWSTETYGNNTKVKVGGFTPGASYLFQHYVAETWYGQGRTRRFKVIVNGTTLVNLNGETDEATGESIVIPSMFPNTPLVSEGVVTADAEGKIEMSFAGVADNATYGGFAIWGTAAPTITATIVADGSDVRMTWTDAKDVLRYYVSSADSAEGPWTDIATLMPEEQGYLVVGAYNPTVEKYYRVVASNGIDTVTTTVKLGDSNITYTDLKTKGETIASDATANYRVNAAADNASDPLNTLGATTISAAMYMNAFADAHTLAIGNGETLNVGMAGILSGGGNMTFGETVGTGAVSPLAGVLTLDVVDAASTFTINAQAKKTSNSDQLSKQGAGKVILAGGTDFGKFAIGDGTLELPYAADANFDKELSGVGTFVKSGSNTLTMATDSKTFSGTFEVKEGTLKIAKDKASDYFGEGAATIKVDSGATLDVGREGAGGNAVNFGTTKVVIEGTGDEGKGALVNSTGISQYNALSRVELSDDATVTATGRFDVRNTFAGAYLALNGHTLTKNGGNEFILTSVPIRAGGNSAKIRAEAGTLGVESSTVFEGDGSIELANNATFSFYNLGTPIPWPIYISATGGRFYYRAGSTSQNLATNDISLDGTLKVGSADGITGVIPAKLTGTGKLMGADGTAGGVVRITNTENDYTGGTEANKGVLLFETAATLPGYDQAGNVTVSGTGNLAVKLGEGGWTDGQVAALVANATAPVDGKGTITIDTNGQDAESGTDEVSKPIGIGKTGEGTYTNKMVYTAGGGIFADKGTLVFNTGKDGNDELKKNTMSGLQVINGATVEIIDSEIDFGNNGLNVGNVGNQAPARLVVAGDSYFHSYLAPKQSAGPALSLGSVDVGRGVLEVRDNAIVSNKVYLGYNQYSQNSVLQSGGQIVNWTGHSSDARLANSQWTSGYWEVAGGSTIFTGYSQLSYNPNSFATLAIKGDGSFSATKELDGQMTLSRGGHGMVYQRGGTFSTVDGFDMAEVTDNSGSSGEAVYNMCDGEADFGGNGVRLSNRKNSTGQVNLNGGVFAAKTLYKGEQEGLSAYVSFNGGTLRAKGDTDAVFGSAGTALDRVTVYEKGAVVDTDGHGVVASKEFKAPEGVGVLAIRWTHDDMIGAPQVIIEGDGVGAKAAADYDAATRRVTGITVTCPGWGYTEKPTVKVIGGGLTLNNSTQTHTIDPASITMGPSVAGPLVKKGAGTLTLSGTNETAGAEVRGGMLAVLADASLAEGPLVLAGGTFSMGSYRATELIVEGDQDDVSTLDCALTLSGTRQSVRKPGLYMRYITADSTLTTSNATAELNNGISTNLWYVQTVQTDSATIEAESESGTETFANKNLNCVYDGYIWNRSSETQVWTFGEHFDDRVYLTIDGEEVLNDVSVGEPWTHPSYGSVTVTPGPHRIHIVVQQGTGGSGPTTNSGWVDWWRLGGWGIGVDFQGRGADLEAGQKPNFDDFVALVDDGSGDLLTLTDEDQILQDFAPDAIVHVNGGTLKLENSQPGLYGGFTVKDGWQSAECPKTNVWATLDYANVKHGDGDTLEGILNKEIGYAYEGYIWNHGNENVTWTFAENFDDQVYLTIDGNVVLNNGTWNAPTKANVTLSPGAHIIRISLYQGTGGSGPSAQSWLTGDTMGVVVDFSGRNEETPENYVPLSATAAGGELPLLTTASFLPSLTALPSDVSIAIDEGAKIDLNGTTLELSGDLYTTESAFVNGTLTPTGVWTVDVADIVAGRILAADTLDLTGAKLKITGDLSLLDVDERIYSVATATQLTGTPTLVDTQLSGKWTLVSTSGALRLIPSKGFILLIR